MIALVVAADSALSKLQALRDFATAQCNNPDSEAALAAIAEALRQTTYAPSVRDSEVIIIERVHFQHTRRMNDRKAAKMRQKRGAQRPGDSEYLIESAPTAPDANDFCLDDIPDGDLDL
jgi:hypothetical protein